MLWMSPFISCPENVDPEKVVEAYLMLTDAARTDSNFSTLR